MEGGALQRRQVMPTRSYLAQLERTLASGPGSASGVGVVRLLWPGWSRPQ